MEALTSWTIPSLHLSFLRAQHSGLTISGVNAEVMPGQWEYQVCKIIYICIMYVYRALFSSSPRPASSSEWIFVLTSADK